MSVRIYRLAKAGQIGAAAPRLIGIRAIAAFTIAYHRPAEGFVFLERDGAQIMLCVRNRRYEIGKMEYPRAPCSISMSTTLRRS
jgi:hypothetical protein